MTSFDRPAQPESGISAWVARFAHLVRPGGHVLDVAAGRGRHTRFFLARGCRVTAADIDVSDLAELDGEPDCRIVQADLESGAWPFAGERFDAVVVTNYLHRSRLPQLAANVAPGGVLLYASFGAGNEGFGRPRNPAFLLQAGELLRAFGNELQVVAYEHGEVVSPRAAIRQRLCAVRGPAPCRLASSG